MSPPRVIVVMGVSGSGKTTVGQVLAKSLGFRFLDADDLHPAANKEKMASGQPLTDADRAPWLEALRAEVEASLQRSPSHEGGGGGGEAAVAPGLVLACSALKETYRRALAVDARVAFVFLQGSPELLRARLAARHHAFMPASLLDSQLATLEVPKDAVTVDIADAPEVLAQKIRVRLGLGPS